MIATNVELTESQDKLVQNLVATGRYQNVGEALRAGLRLLEREEAELAQIQQGLREGLSQVLAGDLADGSGTDAVQRAHRGGGPCQVNGWDQCVPLERH